MHTLPEYQTEPLHVALSYDPPRSGLQIVVVVVCWKQKDEHFGYPVSSTTFQAYPMVDPLLSIDATIAFRNPHGYLPALLFGLFQFKYVCKRVWLLVIGACFVADEWCCCSGLLSVLYGMLDVYFLTRILKYHDTTLGVQYSLMILLLLTTGRYH